MLHWNAARRKTVHTRAHCSKLDSIFKAVSRKAETKGNNTELSKLQAFVQDPVGLLLLLLNRLETEDAIEV